MIGLGWWGKKMTAALQKAKDDIVEITSAPLSPIQPGTEFAEAN